MMISFTVYDVPFSPFKVFKGFFVGTPYGAMQRCIQRAITLLHLFHMQLPVVLLWRNGLYWKAV